MADLGKIRVAVSHYWIVTWRGGEKVLKAILELFPEADVYTLFLDESIKKRYIQNYRVYPSILNRISFLRKNHQKVFPLYPIGIKSLKLKGSYDLLISSESGPAKGIYRPMELPHICYVHTPMRYCWGFTEEYLRSLPKGVKTLARFLLLMLRKWDETTIDNVNTYIANSQNVRDRIRKYYKKDAIVIYPPIKKELFDDPRMKVKGSKGEYFLSFGALVPYKRVDLLVEVFNKRDEKLVVIGEGSERKKLESLAKDNITFLGYIEDGKLREIILKSKALIFPGEEDFGMIPLEVMAAGVPVIAYGKGGALETVLEGKSPESSTGIFFENQAADSLNIAIEKFKAMESDFDPFFIRSHAAQFSEETFKFNFMREVQKILGRSI